MDWLVWHTFLVLSSLLLFDLRRLFWLSWLMFAPYLLPIKIQCAKQLITALGVQFYAGFVFDDLAKQLIYFLTGRLLCSLRFISFIASFVSSIASYIIISPYNEKNGFDSVQPCLTTLPISPGSDGSPFIYSYNRLWIHIEICYQSSFLPIHTNVFQKLFFSAILFWTTSLSWNIQCI